MTLQFIIIALHLGKKAASDMTYVDRKGDTVAGKLIEIHQFPKHVHADWSVGIHSEYITVMFQRCK